MLNRLANWFSARDPGYLRLYAATRVTAAALTTAGITALLVNLFYGQWAPGVMMLAMLTTFFSLQIVNDAKPAERRLSLALGVIPIAAAMVLAAVVASQLALEALVLLALLFVAFYARRYGVRAGELTLLGVMLFFFAVRYHVTLDNLGIFLAAAAVGVASALVFMFVLMPYRPLRSLRQAMVAFYRRAREIVAQLSENLAQAADAQDDASLRDRVRQLRAARRVIENLALAAISPEQWSRERLARLQLDLYNAEQAVDVMVESAARLGALHGELPGEVRRALLVGLDALRDSLQARVAPENAQAAAQALVAFRQQARAHAANADKRAWLVPVVALAAGGAQLGQAVKSSRENNPQTWNAPLSPAPTSPARAAPPAPSNITFAGRELHVTTALGIQAVLASAIAFMLAMLLDMPTPLVAFLSAFLVVSTTAGESARRAWLRVLGTVGGVMVGLVVGELAPDNFLLVLAIASFALFMAVYVTALSYNWMVFWITVALMQPLTLAPGVNLDVGFARVLNITLGAVAAAVIATTVLPLRTRERFNAALAKFLGAVDQHIALFVRNLLSGQTVALDEKEYSISGAYAKLAALFPSAAYEYSPLGQRQNKITAQATQLAALHNYATHLADELELREPAPHDDTRRAVLGALQNEIHVNIQVIHQSLESRDGALRLKQEKIQELADVQEIETAIPARTGYLTVAIARLARIRNVILELGTQQGIPINGRSFR